LKMGEKRIRIVLKRSLIGTKPRQLATARALGLRKIGSHVDVEPTPSILGMVRNISHLVQFEEIGT